jgi:hypothetical protein
MKGYEPADSYSTCYVLTADVDRLYADFRDGLKRALGRVPSRGIPRIGALNDMCYGVRPFVMTDPGGNIIRIGPSAIGRWNVGVEAQPVGRIESTLELPQPIPAR